MSDHPSLPDATLSPDAPAEEVDLHRLVLMAKALSDPIRVNMLRLMAEGRGCCGLPPVAAMAVPGGGEVDGICVCEFQELYHLGQSKVSYHMRILKEAGLVHEESRGKWTFYSLNKKAARELVALLSRALRLQGPCC
jgi:ArsR family transcriptional regulator